jgi:hypothetical protein
LSDSASERLRQIAIAIDRAVLQPQVPAENPRARLTLEDDDALLRVLTEQTNPLDERSCALEILASRHIRDTSLEDLLSTLFHDPDPRLALAAVRAYPAFGRRMAERLHALLSDPRPEIWSEAASLLARRRDPHILQVTLRWLRAGDDAHFEVALCALDALLAAEDRHEALDRLWNRADLTEAKRLALAAALAGLDDERGLVWLAELALGLGPRSPDAADRVLDHDVALGLDVAATILERGGPAVRADLAERIARRMPDRRPGDQVAAARRWIDQRRGTRAQE